MRAEDSDHVTQRTNQRAGHGRDGGRMMYFIEIQCGEGSAQSGDIGSRESGYNLYQFIPVPGFRCHFYLSRNERIFHIEILLFSSVL